MQKPLISVIIPVFNTEKYLHRCIDSVLAQSYPNFELILVNDGSQDNSGKICDDYSEQDSRVRVLHQENQGVSIARNNGMAAAQGEYISFIDSDDWVEPDYLRAFVEAPMSQNRVELPVLDVLHHDAEDKDVYYSGFGALTFSVAKLFNKSIIEENQIQFPPHVKTAEDTLFMADYLNHVDGIQTINYQGYHYETNSQGACERYKTDAKTYSVGLIKELQALYSGKLSKLAYDYLHSRTCVSFHHFVNALYLNPMNVSKRVGLTKAVCCATRDALNFYPQKYKSDKLVVLCFERHMYHLGNILASLTWSLRNKSIK